MTAPASPPTNAPASPPTRPPDFSSSDSSSSSSTIGSMISLIFFADFFSTPTFLAGRFAFSTFFAFIVFAFLPRLGDTRHLANTVPRRKGPRKLSFSRAFLLSLLIR